MFPKKNEIPYFYQPPLVIDCNSVRYKKFFGNFF